MQAVTVSLYISKTAAILAGKAQYGDTTVDVDPAPLTPEQRATLAKVSAIRGNFVSLHHEHRSINVQLAAELGEAPTAEQWPSLLDEIGAALQATLADEQRKAAQAEEAHRASSIAYAEACVSLAPDAGHPAKPYHFRPSLLPAPLAEQFATWEQAVTAFNERRDQERKAREAQRREDERRSDEQRALQLKQWVADHGTDGQRKRMARGLLPEEEILRGMRDQVFSAINLPRYQKISADDVHASYPEQDGECAFLVEPASSATDEQVEKMDLIEAAIPGAVVELRTHYGQLAHSSKEEDEQYQVVRHSIRVTVTVGALTVSREFAA